MPYRRSHRCSQPHKLLHRCCHPRRLPQLSRTCRTTEVTVAVGHTSYFTGVATNAGCRSCRGHAVPPKSPLQSATQATSPVLPPTQVPQLSRTCRTAEVTVAVGHASYLTGVATNAGSAVVEDMPYRRSRRCSRDTSYFTGVATNAGSAVVEDCCSAEVTVAVWTQATSPVLPPTQVRSCQGMPYRRSHRCSLDTSYFTGVATHAGSAVVEECRTAEVTVAVCDTSYFTGVATHAGSAVVEECRTAEVTVAVWTQATSPVLPPTQVAQLSRTAVPPKSPLQSATQATSPVLPPTQVAQLSRTAVPPKSPLQSATQATSPVLPPTQVAAVVEDCRSAEVTVAVGHTSYFTGVATHASCAVVEECRSTEVTVAVSHTSYFTGVATHAGCAVVEECRTAEVTVAVGHKLLHRCCHPRRLRSCRGMPYRRSHRCSLGHKLLHRCCHRRRLRSCR